MEVMMIGPYTICKIGRELTPFGEHGLPVNWENVLSSADRKVPEHCELDESDIENVLAYAKTPRKGLVAVTEDGKIWYFQPKLEFWVLISPRELCLLHL